ncbi:ROK family protein [Chondromyces apiculatus]|uniref:ROK family Glucokinase with ambiguous substrate specificity n=1 Tax=Chondromyces apiculatus DSM 436 TaxID=1192034 RepID=A0A017T202_9BACT|nr:ROK family protein [Chondromyces apiculatus]EYF03007.1 hypothetical protein CAP_6270 [Chondromyces apiculatus DSM 436]
MTGGTSAGSDSGSDIALGVDLGGTKIEIVALRLDPAGTPAATTTPRAPDILARRRVLTRRERGYDAVLAETATLITSFAAELGLDPHHVPLGVGMPGSITRAGLVKNSNTVCLNGRPFRTDLEAHLARTRPIAFDNDANCLALAETFLGAAAPYRDGIVFGVIMGTGVGGGLIAFGRPWPGPQGIGGEWGHHAVFPGRGDPCYCGQRGCLEQFASGPAVEADYARRAGAPLPLAAIATRAAPEANDPHARAAMDTLLDAYGRGLANLIDILDPSAIVLGGGLSHLDALYDEGRARVAHYVFNDELTTPILRNALGDSAGVLGAALLGAS